MAIPHRLRRIAGTIGALLAIVLLVGATYQGVATALERRQFQRPGGLVDVGGFQLHIYCVGEGSPTVVLEAAAGSMSPAWGWVQPEIGRLTRVCSYDRAGLGWSQTRDGRYAPRSVPDDLHMLLEQAGERGPFVLVGHELGALFARMFAGRFPSETAALVLVDDPLAGPPRQSSGTLVAAWPWLARVGLLRATGRLSALAAGLPGQSGVAMRAFLNWPDHLTRAAMEISRVDEADTAVRTVHLDPAVRVTLVVIGPTRQPAMIVTREDASTVARAVTDTVAGLREARAVPAGTP